MSATFNYPRKCTSLERTLCLKQRVLNFADRCSLSVVFRTLQLEERRAENEALCETHRERIQRLWDRLQVSQEEREAFSTHMVVSKKRNLNVVSDDAPVYDSPTCVFSSRPGSCCIPPSPSARSRGPAPGRAQAVEHAQRDRRHPLGDLCVLGQVLPEHGPAAGVCAVLQR